MPVWCSKIVEYPTILHSLLRLVKCTPMLTLDAKHLDSLIGLGGLLLVISNQFAIPILILCVGLEKSK
jgi:hypothetical protein